MQIRIYVFINGNQGNVTNTNAQNAWWDRSNHPAMEDIHIVDSANPDNEDFLAQFQVATFPTVVFVDLLQGGQGRTLTRITGPASYAQIQEVLNRVLNGEFGSGESGEGETGTIEGDGNIFSLGLGLFNFSLPNLLIWVVGGVMVYRALRKKNADL